jgi:hypothetical protein
MWKEPHGYLREGQNYFGEVAIMAFCSNKVFFFSFFFYYSYVHTRLGSFLPPAPTPPPPSPPTSIPSRNYSNKVLMYRIYS